MSLFKLKTIWNRTFPEQEFDQRHLAFGNVFKVPTIAVGSFKGNLRVFSFDPEAKYASKFFTLKYQKSFEEPIIDVKYVSHPDESVKGNTIGILLFKKFVYLTLQNQQDSPMYSAKIMNVEVEPSFAIVQSPLSLATINFSIQSMNPKQIHPIKQSDSIYPFTISQQNMFYMDGEDLVKIKGTIEQWRIIVGRVRSMHLIHEVLLLIGELNLWEVEEGKIIKCKRLEEEVSCGALAHKPGNDFNIIVCNFLMQMLVYSKDYTLLWAVKLDYVPIRLIISENSLIKGALIFLTDQGSVELAYLGTEIQERTLKPIEGEVDIQKVEKETQFYLQKLRQLKNNPLGKTNQAKKTDESPASSHLSVKLLFSQPQQTSQFVENSDELYRSPTSAQLIKCVLTIQLTAQSVELSGLLISLHLPSNILCPKSEVQFEKLKGKQTLKFDCFISKEKFPYDSIAKVSIRYEKGKSTQLIERSAKIPITFQCRIDSYEGLQKADKKITLKCTDNALPAFNLLYPDIMQRGCGQQKKSITFVLANGVKSSIVYNKNLTKVKIQSQVYSGLCLTFIEFISRIQAYLQKSNQKLPAVEVEVPLKELEQQIRDYYSFRQQLKKQYKELQLRTDQFKKTQKKLLLKMKQKNSSIQHVNKLLDFTYQQVLESAQKYEELEDETHIVNHNFEVSLKFIMELVYRRSSATQKAKNQAESIIKFDALAENVLDDEGWAERLAKNTAFYLNKKYEPTLQNIEKLVTWVITKVNNGDWNN